MSDFSVDGLMVGAAESPLVALAVLAGAVVAGFAALGCLAAVGAWCVRHPVFCGFVGLSVALTSVHVWLLLGWWLLVAVVLAAVRAERADHDRAGWWIVAGVCRLVVWLARHWVVTVFGGVTLWGAWSTGGLLGPVVLWTVWGLFFGAWWWISPVTFEADVTTRARGAWRSLTIYWPHWNRTMMVLSVSVAGVGAVPRKLGLVSGRWADRVRVELLDGQCVRDFEAVADTLADGFGALDCQVRRLDPRAHSVELVLRHGDPLTMTHACPVPQVEMADTDLSALDVGIREDGSPFALPVWDAHWLIAGAMGAGKNSIIGALQTALAPMVAQGRCRLLGCNPKILELALTESLFYDLADDPADMCDLLERAVADMKVRARRWRGRARHYETSASDPHMVLFVDELAELTSYGPKEIRLRTEAALQVLTSQGRALGYSVIAAVQDPRKDTIPMRDLFQPVRIGLRLPGQDITNAVLGDGAYERGAHCDRISVDSPGVGYVQMAGRTDPERVRFYWPSNDHLQDLADRFAAPTRRMVDVTPKPEEAATAPGLGFDDDDADDLAAWA